jgi:hypothetical protein
VRTSVSQERVAAALCTEELFLSIVYIIYILIALLHIRKVNREGGGKDTDSQHDTFSGPSWVSHLPAGPHCGLQGFR